LLSERLWWEELEAIAESPCCISPMPELEHDWEYLVLLRCSTIAVIEREIELSIWLHKRNL
jgi:hypothetical protein